jgi:peptidyl-prolyl cis-trans isomerase C
MNELPPEIQSQPFMSYYEELLERVIDIKLIAQEGKKINLEEEPSVKAAIDFVTEKVLMQAFLSKYVQKNISEESLKTSYNNYIADEISREEIKASHILLDTQNEAVEVIKMLNNGDDFAEVAKNKSTGPSGPSGGDLGWFKRGQMVPPFENAAFSLGQNEISQKPIQTQFGWHVIKVFEKRIPQAPSYENMKNNLIQDLERKIVSKKIQDLRNNALIEKLSSSELEPLLNLPSIQ